MREKVVLCTVDFKVRFSDHALTQVLAELKAEIRRAYTQFTGKEQEELLVELSTVELASLLRLRPFLVRLAVKLVVVPSGSFTCRSTSVLSCQVTLTSNLLPLRAGGSSARAVTPDMHVKAIAATTANA